MSVMASARRALRRIGDPVVAAGPAGVRIRTRVHLTEVEAAALAGIGSLLGSVYRAELAGRVQLGQLDRASHAVWRAQRKQAVTAAASSRWAGAITRAVEDQYQLGMRGLSAHVSDLRQAIEVLEQRCALRPGEQGPGSRRGYRSADERFAKTRRLARLRSRLVGAQDALGAGRPSITVCGKRFRRTVAGIPTAKFRGRLTAMAARRGIAIIGVDPAYTSMWGAQHWAKPLQQQTSEPVTGHHAAAAAIGRRGLGLTIRRRPAGPRNGQRTVAGTPPVRPDPQPRHDGRHGSSGPPASTRCVPVHRRTPAASGQHRSGRNRAAALTAAHS
jgi:hypothetical protein